MISAQPFQPLLAILTCPFDDQLFRFRPFSCSSLSPSSRRRRISMRFMQISKMLSSAFAAKPMGARSRFLSPISIFRSRKSATQTNFNCISFLFRSVAMKIIVKLCGMDGNCLVAMKLSFTRRSSDGLIEKLSALSLAFYCASCLSPAPAFGIVRARQIRFSDFHIYSERII